MDVSRISKVAAAAALTMAVFGLAACASSPASDATSTPIGGDVITPVSVEAGDLQGETVELVVGQLLNINTGDLATDSYTAEIEDTAVATFVQGDSGAGSETNPGVEGVGVGTTKVVMTNEQGGIQPLSFTVVVSEK